MLIYELCGMCGNEVQIPSDVDSLCPECGEPILPCSMCNMDEVNCKTDCKFIKENKQ